MFIYTLGMLTKFFSCTNCGNDDSLRAGDDRLRHRDVNNLAECRLILQVYQDWVAVIPSDSFRLSQMYSNDA